jgi:hypothetical protein
MPIVEPDETACEVNCPYCGEQLTLQIDPDLTGSFVHDCEICCRPWAVHVTRDRDYTYVDIARGDGSE